MSLASNLRDVPLLRVLPVDTGWRWFADETVFGHVRLRRNESSSRESLNYCILLLAILRRWRLQSTAAVDWDAPGMDEHGPFENQEAREKQMAKNVEAAMENRDGGSFILGLAHLHSIFGKLRSNGFNVKAFTWL